MMLSKFLKTSLLKSTLIYTICSALNKAVPFLILPILSYHLTPGEFGIVANFNVLLAILVIFINIGVDGVISINYFKYDKVALKKLIFNCVLVISICTILIFFSCILFEEIIYDWFKIPIKYQFYAIAASLATVFTTINLTLWRLEEKPLLYGLYEISQTVVNFVVSIILVVNLQLGWSGRIDGILIATIIFGIFSLWLLINRGYLKVEFSKKVILIILSFGLPLIPHALSIWIRAGVDRIIITKLIDESATGLYATGFQFGVFISFITLAFNNAFVPFLYKNLNETDKEKLFLNKLKIVKITYICLILYTILSVLFVFISGVLIDNLFSDQYSNSKEYIIWAILSQMFQGYYLLFVNYLFFSNKTRQLAVITISCSLLQVFLSYVMVIKFGPIGAGYSTLLVSVINFLLIFVFANRAVKMPWIKGKIYYE